MAYLCDRRYPWAAICERELGVVPVQAFDDLNLMRHLDDYEADSARRPLTLEELHDFFAYCDAEFERRSRLGRKGALTAFRDTVVFKTICAWGLRASEATQLNVVDFHRNATTPEFGRFGLVAVRVGKGSGGSGPGKYISDRFGEYRDALRLERVLTTHCLRHSYLTHLAEVGWPALFAQLQAGHRHASTTAIYTSVSDGYKQTLVRDALPPARQGGSAAGARPGMRICWEPGLIVQRATAGRPEVCERCWKRAVDTCAVCGRQRPCSHAGTELAICEPCAAARRLRRCLDCGEPRRVARRVDGAALCSRCWWRRHASRIQCRVCGEVRRPRFVADPGDVCEECARAKIAPDCVRCDATGRNYARGLCAACTLNDRIDVLIASAPGEPATRAADRTAPHDPARARSSRREP